jgi:pyruvate dehydrogenase E1 component beta subunit
VRREGNSATVVATLLMVERALAAAEKLAAEGIEIEVVDLRSLAPLDIGTVQRSVVKTGHLITVEEQPTNQGWGNTVIASLVEAGVPFKRPPLRIGLPDFPLPYSPGLEDAVLPSADRIATAVGDMVGKR